MAKTPGVKISLDSALAGTKFSNAQGANSRTPGSDTVSGSGVGAPLYNSRKADDFVAVERGRYHAGFPDTPGGHNTIEQPYRADRVGKQPLLDSPPRDSNQFPNLGTTSKAQEVSEHDPSTGLGVKPSGALARS
jgi:hypothetical protein